MKTGLIHSAFILALMPVLCACGDKDSGVNGQVVVYNWGEYIDPDTIEMFEEETGIKVIYDEFENNESMYPKIEYGAVSYDVVCPSDYMISKMIQNDLLAEINYDNIPNAKANIGAQYYDIIKRWSMNRLQAGHSYGMRNILMTS